MHSALTRLQNVFGFFTTVASVVALVIAVTSLVMTPMPILKEGSLTLKNVLVVKGRPHYYTNKKEEYAHIKFDLDVDLSTLFTWNTKQVFLYITANYPSTSPSTIPPSTSIIWDAILPHPLSPSHPNQYIAPSTTPAKSPKSKSSKSSTASKPTNAPGSQGSKPGILRLQSQRPKYQITDPTGRLANRANATLELHWNIQPWVGALTWGSPASVPAVEGAVQRTKSSGGGVFGWLSAWRYGGGPGARTKSFEFPALKERAEAVKSAGKEGLGLAKGGEANRGSPA